MIHKVVSRRDPTFPFKPYWACICGHRLKSSTMSYELYREFARHQEEQNGQQDG